MISTIIQALAKGTGSAMSTTSPEASFFAEHTLPSDAFSLHVDGVGEVPMPLRHEAVLGLQQIANPAAFGLREHTLLDKSVRDTQEIGADKIRIQWQGTQGGVLSRMLAAMREVLGLGQDATLSAHLHNLLIYGPGQFFKPHQDSEKMPCMVASLVLVLPSPHIGGDLLISHDNEQYRFSSENLHDETIRCIAFYADCEHEILPVKQGWRVALTYNLVLETVLSAVPDEQYRNPQLDAALGAYFNDADKTAVHKKLVYLLDYSYSEHSLRWHLLKGGDVGDVQGFLCAAKKLGLAPHLALVESHESWTTEDDDDEPEPIDLIDSDTTLMFFVDLNNQPVAYKNLYVKETEVACRNETGEADLVDTEHEGWTGNAGQTVDYWYRRAALVLWRESDQVALDFELGYDAALRNLAVLTHTPGNEAAVIDKIASAGNYMCPVAKADAAHFTLFARIALYIQNPDAAQAMLAHFSVPNIDLAAVAALVQLQNSYGMDWCLALMAAWKQKPAVAWYEQENKREAGAGPKLHPLLCQFLALGGAMPLAENLLGHYVAAILADDAAAMHFSPVKQRTGQGKRIDLLEDVLRAGSLVADAASGRTLIGHVVANVVLYPEFDLADRVLGMEQDGSAANMPDFPLLRQHVAKGIAQEFGRGLRRADDWSIQAGSACECAYCKTAGEFVRSASESCKIWPLAAPLRDHVIHSFGPLGLPLTFELRKQGSPHKLVITKNAGIFKDAKARFEAIQDYHERMGG